MSACGPKQTLVGTGSNVRFGPADVAFPSTGVQYRPDFKLAWELAWRAYDGRGATGSRELSRRTEEASAYGSFVAQLTTGG